MRPTVVISNGTYPVSAPLLLGDPLVVIADGGLKRMIARLDELPTDAVLVGDLDSADPADVARWEDTGRRVERYPTDKDATDLELALRLVIDEPGPLTVVGGDGLDRFDHLLGEVALLAAAGRRVTAIYGTAKVEVLTTASTVSLTGQPGDILSLLPWSSSVTGVTTTGLRWPLDHAQLGVGSTRGISNEFTAHAAKVSIETGILIVVQPMAVATPITPLTQDTQ